VNRAKLGDLIGLQLIEIAEWKTSFQLSMFALAMQTVETHRDLARYTCGLGTHQAYWRGWSRVYLEAGSQVYLGVRLETIYLGASKGWRSRHRNLYHYTLIHLFDRFSFSCSISAKISIPKGSRVNSHSVMPQDKSSHSRCSIDIMIHSDHRSHSAAEMEELEAFTAAQFLSYHLLIAVSCMYLLFPTIRHVDPMQGTQRG